MFDVSDEYLEAVAGRNREMPVRCKFEGIDEYITEDNIRLGSYNDIVDGNNILSMGNACANKIEMTIINFTRVYVWKGSKFTIEKGLKVNGEFVWIPWGTFWVTDMSTSNNRKTIKLTAYNYMYKLSKMKYTTALVAPFHYRDLLDEFLLQSLMTLNTTAELPDRNDADYLIEAWPEEEFSFADVAGHLAGMVACNARISASDPTVMEFVWYTATGTVIKDTLYQDGFEKLADGVLRVDTLVVASNKKKDEDIVIENTEESTEGELDFRPFDSANPADYPWLTFTYDDATLTASVRLTEGYEEETAGIGIPYSLYYNGAIYNVTSVEEEGFVNCKAHAITLPYTLTTIGSYAFEYCTGLTEITIPENVTTMGGMTFAECTNLETVYLNAYNITEMSTDRTYCTFYKCTALKNIIIGSNVTHIPAYIFADCTGVTRVVIPESVETIGAYAFEECKGLTEITIPKNVSSVGTQAFAECSNLQTVYWNALNIESTASSYVYPIFNKCPSLENVIIGNEVTILPAYLLSKCTNVKSITIPYSVTTIGKQAFYGCTGLTSITIPENVTSVGTLAFEGCSNLETVYWNAKNVQSAGSTTNYPCFNKCSAITQFVFGNKVVIVPEHILCNIGSIASITIPDSVETIGKNAFYGCSGLASVQIGVSANCAISSIATTAFRSTSALTNITIYAEADSVSGSPWGATNATISWVG